MPRIKFFIHEKFKKKKSEVFLYIRFGVGRNFDAVASTKISIKPELWNNEKQLPRKIAESKTKDSVREKCEDLRRHIVDSFNCIRSNDELNASWLKETVDRFHDPNKYEKKINFVEFIDNYIKICKATKKLGTIKSYKTTKSRLIDFGKAWDRELTFINIDLDFHRSFLEYCARKWSMRDTTIGKHIKNVKLFISEAKEAGLKVNNAYQSKRFYKPYNEAQTIYLNDIEIVKIAEVNLQAHPHLEDTRDLFLMACATGLRYSDLTQLKKDNIKGNILEVRTFKTGIKVSVPLNPMALEIIRKHDYKLPSPESNQKFNLYIKEIGELAKINEPISTFKKVGPLRTDQVQPKYKLITSHTARRSFATNCYLDGISTYEIMKMTGHKTEGAFLKYIRITQEQTAKKLANHPRFASNNLNIV